MAKSTSTNVHVGTRRVGPSIPERRRREVRVIKDEQKPFV
jgi:hypothetical protein